MNDSEHHYRDRAAIALLLLGVLSTTPLAHGQSSAPATLGDDDAWMEVDASDGTGSLSARVPPTMLDPGNDSFADQGMSSSLAPYTNGMPDRSDAAPSSSIPSGNPAATDLLVGTGWLGETLGVNRNGFRLAGLNITDVNAQFTGGNQPGEWTGDNLLLLGASLHLEEAIGWKGGRVGMEFLYYSGGDINDNAGTIMGYNSLDAAPPRTRTEIYTLWFRQKLLRDKFVVHLGKLVPSYDFNNVSRAIPNLPEAYSVPSITSSIITPLYLNPTMLGVMPGYYNSASGVMAAFKPRPDLYAQYGFYDGNLAAGRQTGLEGPHFNGYYFHIAEVGGNWNVGRKRFPGQAGAGYWRQTGVLAAASGDVQGAEGAYLFASQRISYEDEGVIHDGAIVWLQLAATNSEFIDTHRMAGAGISYYGPFGKRHNDSIGFAFAYGRMNNNPAANLGRQETIYSWYYQYQVRKGIYLQPNWTYISTPAQSRGLDDVFALTMRAILLF
ncbi:carbohydrate porin [Planctomycetes bacterium Pan216]